MLGYAMQLEMRLLPALTLGVLVVLTGAELQCDPETQYERDGQCCKLCGPGTSMSSRGNCREPQCDECRDNEYQDQYTDENRCDTQPYCDPNRNFEPAVHKSKKMKSTCMCKQGFHCSSETCSSCVPHTACKPGSEAHVKGNHSSDTVCRKCPEGTFSSITSWDSVCTAWTKCEHGYIEGTGTAESDNVCARPQRMHPALWCTLAALGATALVAVAYWRCRGNVTDKMKHVFCEDSRDGEERNTKEDTCISVPPEMLNETDAFLPEQATRDEVSGHGMTPEENLEEESQETGNFTDRGNFVAQERGKSDILSRQESQTRTFTDSS